MSGSMPKKPVLNREKKKSSYSPSVSDFCRLCKCSFKTIYGNSYRKAFQANLHWRHGTSARKIFIMSRVKGERKDHLWAVSWKNLDFLFSRVTHFPPVCAENVQLKLETQSHQSASFDTNLIARISCLNSNYKTESPSRTKKIMTDSSECRSLHTEARSLSLSRPAKRMKKAGKSDLHLALEDTSQWSRK